MRVQVNDKKPSGKIYTVTKDLGNGYWELNHNERRVHERDLIVVGQEDTL